MFCKVHLQVLYLPEEDPSGSNEVVSIQRLLRLFAHEYLHLIYIPVQSLTQETGCWRSRLLQTVKPLSDKHFKRVSV